MKKYFIFAFLVALVLSACSGGKNQSQAADTGRSITVYHSPT